MSENNYLNEEMYQKNVKKIKEISLIILLIGILIGGSVIAVGVSKQFKINSKYSQENKEKLKKQIETEKKSLETKKVELESKRNDELEIEKKNIENYKKELEAKGVEHKIIANYDAGEVYDLYIVTKVLDPSFDYCSFDEYKNHKLTSKYCSIYKNNDENSENLATINKVLESKTIYCNIPEYKNNTLISKYCSLNQELDDMDSEFNKEFDSSKSIPFYMFGAFIIVASCIMSGSVYMISKRREIAAFTTQQMNPITQEHIENMGTSIGKAVANAAKEINPEYKSLKCPNCGANIDGNGDIEKCEYCGQTLIKTGRFK